MKAPEVEIIENIQNRLSEKFPNIIEFARVEFQELHKDLLDNPRLGQLFYGWFFGSFSLYDGKTIPNLCFETINLNENEKILLNNIKEAIPGFFEVLDIKEKIVYLQDMLTKREYNVKTIDLHPMPKKMDCLEASLVKNLKGDYFFFGGFQIREEKQGISWNLQEYMKDLTIDEMTEKEFGIMSTMEELNQKNMLFSYLSDVFGMDNKEINQFLQLSKKERKEVLRNIIEEIEDEEEKMKYLLKPLMQKVMKKSMNEKSPKITFTNSKVVGKA